MKKILLLILVVGMIGVFAFLLSSQMNVGTENKVLSIDLYYYDWESGGEGYIDDDYHAQSKEYELKNKDDLLLEVITDLSKSQDTQRISMFPNEAKINSVKLKETQVIIDFSKENLNGSSSQEIGVLNQILKTIEGMLVYDEFKDIKSVYLTIDGESAITLMGHVDIGSSFSVGDNE